jgi:hypothetical protein
MIGDSVGCTTRDGGGDAGADGVGGIEFFGAGVKVCESAAPVSTGVIGEVLRLRSQPAVPSINASSNPIASFVFNQQNFKSPFGVFISYARAV